MHRFFSDIYWVFWREMKRFLLQRMRIVVSIIQPMVWLVLMGYNLSGLTRSAGVASTIGAGDYLDFMTPGIMVMTALFGGVFGGMSVMWDRRLGFLNKMLAAPIYRAAIPLGKLLALMVQSWFQAIMILLVALLLGVRIVTGVPGVIFMLLMASLFGILMGSVSLSLAARLKSIETLFAINNFLTLPLMFTSSAIFPTRTMPPWLRAIAEVNPLSYAVGPMRVVALQGWIWRDLWLGIVVLVGLTITGVALTVRQFERAAV